MNDVWRVPAILFLAFISIAPLSAAERAVNLTVRIFQVPRMESWDVATPGICSDKASLTCRGDSTRAFPDGDLYLATQLAERADSGAITDEIMSRVIFGNGDFRAKSVSILEIGKFEAKLTPAKPTAQIELERDRTEYSSKEYGIEASLRPGDDSDILIKLRFDAGWSSWGGRLGTSLSSILFSKIVVISEDQEGKLLLVGFPSHDEGPRGTIYWLAIGATRVGTNPTVPDR
jgi:hypothetical protein